VGTESNLLSLSATEPAVRGVPLLTGGDRVEQKCLFALEQGQLLEVFPLLTGGDRVEQVYLSTLEQGQLLEVFPCSSGVTGFNRTIGFLWPHRWGQSRTCSPSQQQNQQLEVFPSSPVVTGLNRSASLPLNRASF
jgi:hypothetical protein